tara:strand:+ start:1900 stop:2013 length:114 start_codon:yes stop_codon:yes gene_type:complete
MAKRKTNTRKSKKKTLGFWDRVARGLERLFSSAFPKK